MMLEPSFTPVDSHLRLLSITNAKHLTIKGGALDMNLRDDSVGNHFTFSLKNIGDMKIARGAIRLSGNNCTSSFVWKNLLIENLPSFSITSANMINMTWEGVVIAGEIETASVNLESSGTIFKMDEVDARVCFHAGWMSGDLMELNISRSRLNLASGAFQRLSFVKNNAKLIIRNNQFGSKQWKNSEVPSFASRAFDFTFKDDSALFNIADNKAECGPGNLEWFSEPKKSVALHWLRCGFLHTLSCNDASHAVPLHPSCNFYEIKNMTTEQYTAVTISAVKI